MNKLRLSCLLLGLFFTISTALGQEKPKKTKKEDLPLSFYEDTEAALRDKMVGVARNYVSFGLGVALPEGNFGSSFDDQLSGYARNGILLSVDGAYVFRRNVGVGGTFSTSFYGIRKKDLESNLRAQFPEGTEGSLTSGKWSSTVFAVGPYLALPENKVTLDLRVLLGMMFARSPKVNFDGMYEEVPATYSRTGDLGVSPTLIIGVGVSYPIPNLPDFRVFAKGEYMGGRPRFKFSQATLAKGYEVQSDLNQRQSTGNFGLSVGVKYEFGYAKDTFIEQYLEKY